MLKIRDASELGDRIVVQGGAFKNDALLRAFELAAGREVTRPEMSELMGAFGAALLARDAWGTLKTGGGTPGTLIGKGALESFSSEVTTHRCAGCGNRCILTNTSFGDGRSYVSGNRCERGDLSCKRDSAKKNLPPNIFELKYKRLFGHYMPADAKSAARGVIGIPRALNMYENYPLWFTLFTKLGFRVELSSAIPDESLGIDTIPSQTVCYPAKLAHRHIADLLRRGVKRIFYPVILKEIIEFADSHQHFNCPVVTGYPDVAFLNMDGLRGDGVEFLRPALPLDSPKRMLSALAELLAQYGVSRRELRGAIDSAYDEMKSFKRDIAGYGREAISWMKENGAIGIVLAGHPYHLDPEVNHGIPELVNSYGVAVFTEDSVCGRAEEIGGVDPMYVVDQWSYHSRLYRAASVVARHPDFRDVQMVQLNSFGCGLDAVSSDQAAALLESRGRLHTLIKIDEGKNNGAVKIRIRSLLAAARTGKDLTQVRRGSPERLGAPSSCAAKGPDPARTILCPPLSPHHFQFLETAFQTAGVNFHVLPEGSREATEIALKYVNNDACYPAMFVVGQFLQALRSGEYDPDSTDCLYAQTGGACRASNYVPLLRRALDSAGYPQVRILAANAQDNGGAERFSVPAGVFWRSILAIMYGDLLMRLSLRTRPYEIVHGAADALYESWVARCRRNVADGSWRQYRTDVKDMTEEFAALPIDPRPKPRVGIVGEILVKYHANANERLVEIIETEGGEAVTPDLAGFLFYCLYDPVFAHKKLSGKLLPRLGGQTGITALDFLRRPIARALKGTRFGEIHDVYDMADQAATMISPANQGGEGWLLTAEMMRLIEDGVNNVLCVQPFACLPNH
ncbi:MAG: acyl-CoA dehydratase activase-related protein, partial [Synergistaceae bacterium]|nr:acyl-CoA dehydratase activase-related protein [Synergistaceae bacterium]